jgi:hypothetical protein
MLAVFTADHTSGADHSGRPENVAVHPWEAGFLSITSQIVMFARLHNERHAAITLLSLALLSQWRIHIASTFDAVATLG